jgi:hypothetical protein
MIIASDLESISDDTISWDKAENSVDDKWGYDSSFSHVVIMGAILSLLAVFGSWTGFDLVIHWVIFVLFPPMAFNAFFSEVTAILVIQNEIC